MTHPPSPPQWFHFLDRRYNVQWAMSYIRTHRHQLRKEPIPTKELLKMAGIIRIDLEWSQHTNPKKSGIVVIDEFSGGQYGILIDGWHRLYKLNQMGFKQFPCWIIDDQEVVKTIRGID